MTLGNILDTGEEAKATQSQAAADQEGQILIGRNEAPRLFNAFEQNGTRFLEHGEQSSFGLKNTLPSKFIAFSAWLQELESNQHPQVQSLVCYHYTILLYLRICHTFPGAGKAAAPELCVTFNLPDTLPSYAEQSLLQLHTYDA